MDVNTAMRFFTQKSDASDTTVLTVFLDDQIIAGVTRRQAPVELRPSVELTSNQPAITFLDSSGKKYTHDLASVKREGIRWLHLSIRVSEQFAAQVDALLNNALAVSEQEFKSMKAKGLRLTL